MTSPALFEEEDGVITHNGRMPEPDATIVRFEILQIGILIVHSYHVRYSLDNRNVVCADTGTPWAQHEHPNTKVCPTKV